MYKRYHFLSLLDTSINWLMPNLRETGFYYFPGITRYQQQLKKIVNWFNVCISNKRKNGHAEIQLQTHFLYSMLSLDVIRLFSSPTGGDPTVSKSEHAELSKNVQEMKENLSSLQENSVSDTTLQKLVIAFAHSANFHVSVLFVYLPLSSTLPCPDRTTCMYTIISSVHTKRLITEWIKNEKRCIRE